MATVKSILDKRRRKQDGSFPVVIRIIHNRKTKMIPLGFSCPEKLWDGKCSQIKEAHPESLQMNSEIAHAVGRLYQLIAFKAKDSLWCLTELAKEYNGESLVKQEVTIYCYGIRLIEELRSLDKQGTADWYQVALNSLTRHLPDVALFEDLTPAKCAEFEKRLLLKGLAVNGVSAYLRAVRALFNRAIRDEVVELNYYPFNRFRIKSESTRKRSLTEEELRLVFTYQCEAETERMWMDVYKLSFYLMGMNFTDLVSLKHSDIRNGRVSYRRAKTKRLFDVKLTSAASLILQRYSGHSETYSLPVLADHYKDGETKKKVMKDKLKQCNKYLKRIGEHLNLNQSLTTYTARHTWATTAKRLGFPNELIAEGLGHQYGNRVTAIYLDSFDKKEVDAMNKEVSHRLEYLVLND